MCLITPREKNTLNFYSLHPSLRPVEIQHYADRTRPVRLSFMIFLKEALFEISLFKRCQTAIILLRWKYFNVGRSVLSLGLVSPGRSSQKVNDGRLLKHMKQEVRKAELSLVVCENHISTQELLTRF